MVQVIKPQPKQEQFLSSPYDLVFYGGSAGGGKTWALLLDPVRHIKNPGWRGGLFRQSYAEMDKPGSVWDESMDFYPQLGSRALGGKYRHIFPSGAVLDFSYIDSDKTLKTYKGAQYATLYFDQLEELSQYQFLYMLSRNRTTCGIKPYTRATANPQPGWLADFIDWWIADDGYANLARAGIPRWFVNVSDTIHWASTSEELERKFAHMEMPPIPKSVTFIPATVFDNPELLAKDPDYLSNLMALPYIERERLLGDRERGGNWKIVPAAGLLYNRAWYELVPTVPGGGVEVLYWDLAATEEDLQSSSKPSKTACVAIRYVKNNYYIRFVYSDYLDPAGVDRALVNISSQIARECALEGTRLMVRWEEEPGSASKRESRRYAMMLDGLDARGDRASRDKFVRGRAFSAASESGLVYVLSKTFAETWLNHMHNQPEIGENDIHDATTGAYNMIVGKGSRSRTVGSFQG